MTAIASSLKARKPIIIAPKVEENYEGTRNICNLNRNIGTLTAASGDSVSRIQIWKHWSKHGDCDMDENEKTGPQCRDPFLLRGIP